MSMVAVFETDCCHRELVHGRFKGSDMYPPSLEKCPFGCALRRFDHPDKEKYPNGRPEQVTLKFLRYQDEELVTPELRATCLRLETQSGNFWHKYNEQFLAAKAQSSQQRLKA